MEATIKYLITGPARILNSLRWDLFLVLMRFYVGYQFWKAGLLKMNSWDSTLFLFEHEYRVPILSPYLAALLGTVGELLFPLMLFVGLAGRLGALGLSVVNVVAVIAYAHVIFSPGFENTVYDHWIWGLMLLAVMVFGPGKLSLDCLINRYRGGSEPY